MIRTLAGTVARCSDKEIVLLTSGGVGYHVFPAGSLLASCKEGAEMTIEIMTIVRETEISLYGFASITERQLFEKLLSVSGIGPKMALQIVSTPVDQFLAAVSQGDDAFLTRIPGLGKKTAQRLIVELQGKLDLSAVSESTPQSDTMNEASDALQNLGYDRRDIAAVMKKNPDAATMSAEELVRYFLGSHA